MAREIRKIYKLKRPINHTDINKQEFSEEMIEVIEVIEYTDLDKRVRDLEWMNKSLRKDLIINAHTIDRLKKDRDSLHGVIDNFQNASA